MARTRLAACNGKGSLPRQVKNLVKREAKKKHKQAKAEKKLVANDAKKQKKQTAEEERAANKRSREAVRENLRKCSGVYKEKQMFPEV